MNNAQRPRIKICGLKDAEMALFAARAGADAIGLVSYPPSPRHVSLAQAATIARVLPPFVSVVALFVDAEASHVRAFVEQVRPSVLQFHGSEPPEWCEQFGVPWIKAVRVQPGLDLLQYASVYAGAQGLLLDAWVAGQPGGTGECFDWSVIPADLDKPLILSGGLNPQNVAAAIRQVRPWAVDVSSGVESGRGIKDASRISGFITEVQHAFDTVS